MAQWPASMGSIAPGMYYGMPGGGLTSSQPAFPGMQPQSMMPIAAHSRGMVTTAAPVAADNSWAFPQTSGVTKVTYQPQNRPSAPEKYVAKKSTSPSKKGTKRVKDPNHPKKPPPAFLKWATEERGEIKKQLGNLAPPDMSKELGHRWAALNPEVKQFYQERYAIDKMEYDRAKEAYKSGMPVDPNQPLQLPPPRPAGAPGGQNYAPVKKRRSKKGKRLRDPNAPKKPAPAFLKWSMEERDAIKQELGNLKPGDMGKELGRRWAVLNPGIKQLYHERYQQDKKDYDEARGKYNPSQEYLRQKGSGAPKKPPPSFLKWSMYERVEVKKELGNISVTEMGKELGRRWAALTPEVKQVYKERYHQEKEMYNQARANYVPSEYELSLQKEKKRSKRDPNQPKKPAPAFLKWSADEREEVKKQLGNLSPADMSKVLGKRWGNLAPEVKQFYQERYAVEKEEWDLQRKSKSIKTIKDPAAPKKPAPAFLKWAQDERQIVKKQLGNLSPGNMGKVLGKRWAELSPHVKQIYQERYKRCKAEYDFARANYEPSKAFLRKKNQIEEMRGENRIKTEMEQNRNYNNPASNQVRHQQPAPGHPAIQHQPAEVSWQDVPDTRWVTNNMPSNNSVKKEVKSELKDYYASFR